MLLKIIFILIPTLCFSANDKLVISPKAEDGIKEIVKSMPDDLSLDNYNYSKDLDRKLIRYIKNVNSNNMKVIYDPVTNKNYILFFCQKDLMLPMILDK